ncbi:hypothetical protein TKK_0005055 [Trichogramma kaykai]
MESTNQLMENIEALKAIGDLNNLGQEELHHWLELCNSSTSLIKSSLAGRKNLIRRLSMLNIVRAVRDALMSKLNINPAAIYNEYIDNNERIGDGIRGNDNGEGDANGGDNANGDANGGDNANGDANGGNNDNGEANGGGGDGGEANGGGGDGGEANDGEAAAAATSSHTPSPDAAAAAAAADDLSSPSQSKKNRLA